MKYIKYILAGFISVLTINSCKMDLDLTNPNQLSPETFFKNEIQLQSAVNAIYANLQTQGLYSRHMYFMMDNMSQENAGNPQLEADKVQYINYSWPTDHGAIFMYWDNCYRGINKANFAIDNALLMEEGIAESVKNKYIGEAKFMRALYYFFLVSRFGDIPLYTTVSNEPLGKSSKDQVFALIISDLEDAASSLLDADQEDFGRATKGAANALLGRVHLFRGNHDAARTALLKVYGKYSLTDNFYDNFMDETQDNEEAIFDVMFSSKYGGADAWGSTGTGIAEVTFRGQEYGLTWFNVYPSNMTLDEFEPGDPRYADSFWSNGDILDPNGAAVPAVIPLGRRAAWKKYSQYYKQLNSDTNSGINFRVIRYADVLLMLAECENEVGTAAQAIAYLNEVRNRPSTSMPNYGTPAMNTAGYPVSTKAEIFAAIVHERQVELCGEQVRFNDLLRWGLDDDVLSSYGYVKGKHDLFPIPQNEIDANEMLTQADQNPGY